MKSNFAILSVLALTACGTIFSGTGQNISFDSNVKGTEIYVDGFRVCSTPCTYEVDRSMSDLEIVAKKSGYRDQRVKLRANFNRIALFNLTGGLSWTTDIAMGGAWEYKNNHLYIEMEKNGYKHADLSSLKRDIQTRRLALMGYDELKIEAAKGNGEYLEALAALSGKTTDELSGIVNRTEGEVKLAHTLTGIH